jgi:enoyl-CoA hydratase
VSSVTDLGDPSADVLARADRGVGRLILNRPRAINALDIGMIRLLAEALDAWERDADVEVVLLEGAGERGFCAGGDVRALREQVLSGDADGAAEFFREEYALNARIAEYPKPFVVLADGITMGGGVGLAGHAGFRVVTERSKLAMPETRIGFTPDVGGTWLLGRAPGRIGEYLALTGGTMDGPDAVYAGFADHYVPAERLDGFRDALETRADPTGPAELVLLFDETPEASALETARPWIDDAFAADSVPEIIDRLRARPEPDAAATADLLLTLSPVALTVALAAVRSARALPGLRDVLEQEYGLVMWFATTQPDLLEGIRAQLVDKDRSPRWQPASLDEVPDGVAADAFAFRPVRPLWD